MNELQKILGIVQSPVSHTEKLVSALGGAIAILAVLLVSKHFSGDMQAALIVASMGASAVLLFAVPHGQLSQPWPLVAGHGISALIGVSCALLFPGQFLAGSLAVGLSIAAMYYLKCTHPPGGATALSAVIGGEEVAKLGYQFVLTPVLLNVLLMLLIAVGFNYLFGWRRYPAYLHRRSKSTVDTGKMQVSRAINHEDFVYALSEIDSLIDVSEHDLLQIYDIATRKSQESSVTSDQVSVGDFFSNGKYGVDWSVRQVVDESRHDDENRDIVIYKVVAGLGRRQSNYCTRNEFLLWAKHKVQLDEENWKRVQNDH